jgi:hypothetical protein
VPWRAPRDQEQERCAVVMAIESARFMPGTLRRAT